MAFAARVGWWVARRAAVIPSTVAAAALGDAVASALRMYRTYRVAESRLPSEAARLAGNLTTLAKEAGPYRLVGHSLGGALVCHAIQMGPSRSASLRGASVRRGRDRTGRESDPVLLPFRRATWASTAPVHIQLLQRD